MSRLKINELSDNAQRLRTSDDRLRSRAKAFREPETPALVTNIFN